MATDLETSVAELIVNTNIISDVINEDATTEVSTSNGPIPSLRKALADNVYFQDPVPWSNGTNETEFNQLRTFTDGTVWWSPSATTVNPVPMGVTPVGDSNWFPFQDRNLRNNILQEVTRFNIKGTFAAGFTYSDREDVGLDNNGVPWTYTGALPFIVPSGSTPSTPVYKEEKFSSLSALDDVYNSLPKQMTYSEAITEAELTTTITGTLYRLSDVSDALYELVAPSDTGGYYIYTTSSDGRKLRLKYDNLVNLDWAVPPTDLNDNKALLLWSHILLEGVVKDIRFVAQQYNFSGSLGSNLFLATDIDNLSVKTNGALFNVDANAGNGIVNIFHLKGCKSPNIDAIRCSAPRVNADNGEVVQALLIEESATRKTENPVCPYIYAKNGSGVRIQCAQSEYELNGFDSNLRSDGIKSEIYIDQTERVFNSSNEYAGYGINLAFAGDDTNVNVKCIGGIHRMYHVYGCQRVEINGYAEESDATPFLISTFGSVVRFKSKVELNQNTARPAGFVYINPRGVGASGGTSADINAARTHLTDDINISVSVLNDFTVGSFASSGFTVDKTESSPNDSDISFNSMRLSMKMPSIAADSGFQWLPSALTQSTSNMVVSDIVFDGLDVLNSNSRFTKIQNQRDWLRIRNSKLLTSFINADSPTPTGNGVILDNTTVELGIDESGVNSGTLVQVINGSRLSARANTDTLPFGKLFRDSYLGNNGVSGGNEGVYIESKGFFDVFTPWDDSGRNRNPTGVERDVVMGRTNLSGVNSTPLNTVIRGTSNLSTSSADLYIPQLVVGGPVGADNPREVSIAVRPSGSSGWAIASGYLAIYGGSTDLTTATINMDITSVMDNATGQSYTASDFSVSATSSDQLTFSCSVTAADMIVTVQR